MKTTLRTEEEAARVSDKSALKPGWYIAVIDSAGERISASRNSMIELGLIVKHNNGERTMRDYLLDNELVALKLLHAIEAAGIMEKHKAGSVAASDFVGKTVKVRIDIDKKKRGAVEWNIITDYAIAPT